MADTEHIEARLCAYVEGELDAQGRAEIEQHLASNPQHRQLLEQLVEQRQVVRDLPREKAPDDLYESFQSQLERSVLLAGEGREHGEPIRFSRRPQMYAAAAIVLLTISLAGVLLVVLPQGPARRPSEFAIAPGPTTAPFALNVIPTTENFADKLAAAETNKAIASKAPAAEAAPMAKAMKRSADVFGVAGRVQEVEQQRKQTQSPMFATDLDQRLLAAGGSQRNPVVVVVATSDPYTAQDQVRQYLVTNGIAWQPLAEPMPAPLQLGAGQQIEASRAQQTQRHLKSVATQKDELVQQSPERQKSAPSAGYSHSTTLPALADSGSYVTNSGAPLAGALQQQAPAYGQQLFLARNLTPKQVEGLSACVATIQSSAGSSLNQQAQLPQGSPATAPTAPVVSKGYTSVASATLRDGADRAPAASLDDQKQVRESRERDETKSKAGASGGAGPTTQPAVILAPDDLVAFDFVNLPGADDDQIKVQKVSGEGEITLPGLGRIKAQGQTPQQLADSIMDAYRRSALNVTGGKVTVRAVTGPATRSAEGVALLDEPAGATTKPAKEDLAAVTAPVAAPAAPVITPAPAQILTEQPAATLNQERGTTTQPGATGVDVVIVVQSDATQEPSATTAPASTVPSAAPPPSPATAPASPESP